MLARLHCVVRIAAQCFVAVIQHSALAAWLYIFIHFEAVYTCVQYTEVICLSLESFISSLTFKLKCIFLPYMQSCLFYLGPFSIPQ